MKLTAAAEHTIAQIAKRNGIDREDVIDYIDLILAGGKVSKHSNILTGRGATFSCPRSV